MPKYEYRILHGKASGTLLFPWASQKSKDLIGPGSFEKKLNDLARDGWVVISCSTAALGSFLWVTPMATVVLQRRSMNDQTDQST